MSLTNGVLTLLPPPEGYVVNFENPRRTPYGLALVLVYAIGSALSLLGLSQHLYVKWWMQRMWRDPATVCLIASWIISLTSQSLVISWYYNLELGVHAWEMPIERFIVFLKSFTLVATVFNVIHCLSKLSILFSYRGLSPQLWWRWAIHAAMIFVIGYCTALFFSLLFACKPIYKAWDVLLEYGSCIDRQGIWLSTSILGFVSDLVLLSLPFPLVLRLQLRLSLKLGVLFMFVIGSATFITSIIRLYYLLQPEFSSPDQTWDIMPTIVWALVELNLLVICPSMFTLRKFAIKVAPTVFSGKSTSASATPQRTPKSLRTFGQTVNSRRKHDEYGELVEEHHGNDGFDMNTLGPATQTKVQVWGRGSGLRSRDSSPMSNNAEAGNGRQNDDWNSEDGIVYTRTVRVEVKQKSK
ncbi:hypothetical protein F5Y18DRAFT_323816 [Xylariaceae sp. FL1019]|nr:hypothetical protein F5Y18DRAFT_323816 [Xylariaceae sp. FL1019]